MPATTLDGADRLIALARNVSWPAPLDACASKLVNVTKIGEKYGVRVRIAGVQRYFGSLDNKEHAARLADLMTHSFARCNEARFNFSRDQAVEDTKQQDLRDLVERWSLLFEREGIIQSCPAPAPEVAPENVVTLEPSELDKLRIQIRDLFALVDSLTNQVAELQQPSPPVAPSLFKPKP